MNEYEIMAQEPQDVEMLVDDSDVLEKSFVFCSAVDSDDASGGAD